MTTAFDPTNKTLTITRNPGGDVTLTLNDGKDVIADIPNEDAVNWSNSKILAYCYLQALYHRGCTANQRYNESIFTLLTNTLLAVCEQDDFTRDDWASVQVEFTNNDYPQPLYLVVSTENGYDITIRYMAAGVAWREVLVRSEDAVPSIDQMYDELFNGAEKEWVSNGAIFHDGMTYRFDQAASAVFTVNRRLQIDDADGALIYSDEDVKGLGIIDAVASLHRQMQLGLWYGAVAELSNDHKLLLSNNAAHLLQDMFGMGEYLELEDGASHSVRGSVGNDIHCLISHTYLAETSAIRADFRFFTQSQTWAIERSVVFGFDEPPVNVVNVYTQHQAQIRAGLGLDLPEPEMQELADIPFDNRDAGFDTMTQPFTPVTPEEEAAYYQTEEEDVAGEPLLITQVVAVGPRGGIGMGNDLLFDIKEDMRFFKQVTTGHVVIMGRKTFESIGKPLPNRHNIVITTDPEYVLNLYGPDNDKQHDNLHCVTSVEEAVMLGGRLALTIYGNNELMVIGGAAIYQQFMPMTQRILLTSVTTGDDSHADVFYPLTGEDIQREWLANALNGTLEENGVSYERYELTRKQ